MNEHNYRPERGSTNAHSRKRWHPFKPEEVSGFVTAKVHLKRIKSKKNEIHKCIPHPEKYEQFNGYWRIKEKFKPKISSKISSKKSKKRRKKSKKCSKKRSNNDGKKQISLSQLKPINAFDRMMERKPKSKRIVPVKKVYSCLFCASNEQMQDSGGLCSLCLNNK